MAHVVLFHSVLGLRSVERAAAGRLRAAGHVVVTPDLYAGEAAETIDEGFALMRRIGWAAIVGRARDAAAALPDRPGTAGVLLLHGVAGVPASVRAGLPVQLQVADPDAFAPPTAVAAFEKAATDAGAVVEIFTYPGVGHFYTDEEFPDHDPDAAELTWQRSLRFLRDLP